MKSKIAILLMPFIHSFFFKENLMKLKIAMFNLNRKSTFSATLLALIVAAVFIFTSAIAQEMVKDPSTGKMVTKPEYGGTLTYANKLTTVYIDSWFGGFSGSTQSGVTEKLGIANWGIDRDEFDLKKGYVPLSVLKGSLAESWEQPDPKTLIFHIRKGVQWHDKPPMSGRALTAKDVEYNWRRMLGLGKFTEPSPHQGQLTALPIESITATDERTVVFKLKEPQLGTLRNLLIHHAAWVYPPEVIEQHGDVRDWRNVVGTGPYMLTDYVEGLSMTFTKNPDYWGFDEKYPQNRLPYIDQLTGLILTEDATILAAIRSAKIDFQGLPGGGGAQLQSIDQAESLRRTNPELVMTPWAYRAETAFSFNQTEPLFKDVNVRKAMQMALDLETINQTYYKGYANITPRSLLGDALVGYIIPFDQWPEAVKQGYRYDPAGAEALLDAAGLTRGADGIRFKTVLSSLDLWDLNYVEIAADYWGKIGIDVEIRVLDRPAYMPAMFGHTYGGLLHTIAAYDNPPMDTITWDHSSSIGKTSNTGHQDPVYDALVEAAQAATSIEEQQRVVRVVDLYHVANHLRIWSPKPPQFNVNQPWVKGYNGEIDLGWGDRAVIFSRLWIDQDLKKEMGH